MEHYMVFMYLVSGSMRKRMFRQSKWISEAISVYDKICCWQMPVLALYLLQWIVIKSNSFFPYIWLLSETYTMLVLVLASSTGFILVVTAARTGTMGVVLASYRARPITLMFMSVHNVSQLKMPWQFSHHLQTKTMMDWKEYYAHYKYVILS